VSRGAVAYATFSRVTVMPKQLSKNLAGANVNAQCDGGWTPLMRACNAGQTETARLLIQSGADVNTENSEGYTAYGRTMLRNEVLIRLLKDNGAV
jgi:uncharacterized protein